MNRHEDRLAPKLLLAVFLPFATGYFLSFFFRNVNAVIAKDLAREFSLTPSEIGLLTSAYLFAFALAQLPVGVLLDRYGPRRVMASLLCVAGGGALTFGLAQDFLVLTLGRAMIGLGVSAGLMGAIKGFSLWFPPSRLATLNGWYIAVGGVGGMAATAPVEAMLGTLGWRALFYGLALLSLFAAVFIYAAVPEKPLPGKPEPWREQFGRLREIFSRVDFWRIVLPLVASHATYQALQGLWLGPWLTDVAGLDRAAAANMLLGTVFAYTLGSIFFGIAGDRLARLGLSRMTVYKLGLTTALVSLAGICLDVQTGRLAIILAYGFSVISAALAYALLAPRFPPEMTGRVVTASNLLMFGASFACQWGIGAVLKQYPVLDGHYSPEGYSVALGTLALTQLVVLAWLWPMKEQQ
ncbi:MAG: MFS transporter [Betaproteobacteria bacterium]|nr:MFS transporter [Betaproteobacteria bacterium]